jgi:metal-responsive CopG/Arc/MetJ family transcriptional regulator
MRQLQTLRTSIMMLNVKTIAISIDEPTIMSIDRIRQRRRSERASTGGAAHVSRSEIVREALQAFVRGEETRAREESDRAALSQTKDRLKKQLEALVADQAEP